MRSEWSRDEDKAFEDAIAMHWFEKDSEENWNKIASMVPAKTLEEIKLHFQILVDDVSAMEGGHIEVPNYESDEPASSPWKEKRPLSCGFRLGVGHDSGAGGRKGGSWSEQERRKGIPWTKEEHRRLEEYIEELGRIEDANPSRKPQAEVLHQAELDDPGPVMFQHTRHHQHHQQWGCCGGVQGNVNVALNPPNTAATGPSLKPRAQGHIPGMGLYSMPVGHPVVTPPGNLASAVGTLVMIPIPCHHPHPHPSYMVPVSPPPMYQ